MALNYKIDTLMKHRSWLHNTVFPGVFLFALSAWIFVSSGAAVLPPEAPVVTLRDGQEEYLLGTNIEYLEDTPQTLSIGQVSSPEFDSEFIRGNEDILNLGTQGTVYWLRLTITNESSPQKHWVLELARPSIPHVYLFSPSSVGDGFTETKTGFGHPFSTRDVPHENFVFNLDIAPEDAKTYYLRVEGFSLLLPLRIWERDAFTQRDQTSRLILASSFGAMAVMLVINGILFFSVRYRGYLYYIIFQFLLLLGLASYMGYASRYLWPNVGPFNIILLPLLLEGIAILTILFAWEFLRFDPRSKWVDTICFIMVAILVFTIPFTFKMSTKSFVLLFPLTLVAISYAFVLGIRAMRRGYRPARYYLFAWSILLFTAFGAILSYLGWFTAKNIIIEQAVLLGVVHLVTFQSLALTDRIQYFRQVHLDAQDELILQQQETLELKEELNIILEKNQLELEERVAQRTHELTELNAQLSNEISERQRVQDELEQLAMTDPLTGLFNRRYFFEVAKKEFAKSIRYNRPLSVMVFDLDEFKEINDTYGHQAGDEALIHIGKLLLSQTRQPDILARYGGEEFIVLMPETSPTGAQVFAERLRQLVEDSPVQYKNNSISLTISAGISGRSDNNCDETLDGFISQADQAMYKAKNTGRNQVFSYPEAITRDDQEPSSG